MHSCKCGSRWAGLSYAHCSAPECHLTFSSVYGFDRHRNAGRCLTAARMIGLGFTEVKPGVWGRRTAEDV